MGRRTAGSRWVFVVAAVVVLAGVAAVLVGGSPFGPADGTTTMDERADELPAGVVVDGATDVESTVARQGDAISAAVTYVVDRPGDEVLAAIEAALSPDWQRRSASSDGTTQQVLFDGPDEATLTVSTRASVGGTGVAAVLARA